MKMSPKRLVVLGAVVGAVAAIAVPIALAVTAVGTLRHADSALGHERLFRDAVPSTCHGKANPGTLSITGRRVYDTYRFKNSATTSKCAHVWLEHAGGVNAFAQANSTFDPLDVNANYLGDAGQSGSPQWFSFPVAAGQSFDVVVAEVNGGASASGFAYALTVKIGGVQQPAPAGPVSASAHD